MKNCFGFVDRPKTFILKSNNGAKTHSRSPSPVLAKIEILQNMVKVEENERGDNTYRCKLMLRRGGKSKRKTHTIFGKDIASTAQQASQSPCMHCFLPLLRFWLSEFA
jgi:hypothetical protein